MSYKEIWVTLSKIDCSEFVEKKQNLSYLSWANALAILMDHYPEATWEYTPDVTLPNETVEVGCVITIGDCKRHMTLPVMDNKNKSIVNPTSRDISDSRMRCWVKCVALFGLGLYLYRGHDLPSSDREQDERPITEGQIGFIIQLCGKSNTEVTAFTKWLGVEKLNDLSYTKYDYALSALNAKLSKMARDYEQEQADTNRTMEDIPDGQ